MKKIKASDVWNIRMTFKAVAECVGVDDTGCTWTPFYPQDDKAVRQQAKEHVRGNPTHHVVVTVSNVTEYYVSSSILRTLEEE